MMRFGRRATLHGGHRIRRARRPVRVPATVNTLLIVPLLQGVFVHRDQFIGAEYGAQTLSRNKIEPLP